jgi:PKD repeat protein
MEKKAIMDPKVRIIYTTGPRSTGKKKSRYAKGYYSSKKGGVYKKPSSIIVYAVITIIILALLIAYLFPGWQIVPSFEEENISPEPSIEVINVAKKSSDLVTVDVNTTVIFSAINSTDQDGSIKKYKWDFGDGSTGIGVKVQHTYEIFNTYTVTLEIEDNDGSSASTQLAVKVNALPVAVIELEPPSILVNAPVRLSGSGSYDPDWTLSGNGIQSYLWEFGDGFTSNGMDTTHNYTAVGNYTITLTVWDNDNSRDSITRTIEVIYRTYNVVWSMNNDTALNRLGFTLENQTTGLNTTISQNDLHTIRITLNWTDYLPLLNASDDNPDEFELEVTSPLGQQVVKNSTAELIIIEFSEINVRDDYTIHAESMVAATEILNGKSPPSDKEAGTWLFDITAVSCPGGIFVDESLFLNDSGNSWRILVEYFYYTVSITEI